MYLLILVIMLTLNIHRTFVCENALLGASSVLESQVAAEDCDRDVLM